MALLTEMANPKVKTAAQNLLDKHYYRKHGANAYYGQKGFPLFLYFDLPFFFPFIGRGTCSGNPAWIVPEWVPLPSFKRKQWFPFSGTLCPGREAVVLSGCRLLRKASGIG